MNRYRDLAKTIATAPDFILMPVMYLLYKKKIITEAEYNALCETYVYPSSVWEGLEWIDGAVKEE